MESTQVMNERRWMLVAGITDYGGEAGAPDLPGAAQDAVDLYTTLRTEYAFQGSLLANPRDVTRTLRPDLARQIAGSPTANEIIDGIAGLRNCVATEDIVVVALFGHGSSEPPGYFIPSGGSPAVPSTLLMYKTLLGELSALPTRNVLLILGCCFSGIATVASGTVLVMAATGAGQLAADRADSVRSPFVDALVKQLVNVTPPGGVISLPALFQAIRTNVIQSLRSVADAVSQEPCCSGWLFDGTAAERLWTLRRSGFHLDIPARYHCRVGESLPLPIHKAMAGRRWRLEPRNLAPVRNEDEERDPSPAALIFEFAGDYQFDIVMEEPRPCTVLSIAVRVEDRLPKPLSLEAAPLPVIFRGEPYRATLTVTGGHPPYTILPATGLPHGLKASWTDSSRELPECRIELSGVVPNEPHAGKATSEHSLPCSFPVEFHVRDARGAQIQERRRLVVAGRKDYCEIKEGGFVVGYCATVARNEALRRMMAGLAASMTSRSPTEQNELAKAARLAGAELAESIVSELIGVNPGSQGHARRFFIRKYPVTNAAWRTYVRARQSQNPPPHIPSHWRSEEPYFPEEESTLPVVRVPYEAIRLYLAWKGTRLPSAWEWERAARSTDGRLFPWGDDFNKARCNLFDSGHKRLLPVDHHDAHASPDGVCDLCGNAAEWVERRVYSSGALYQKFRGGSFRDPCLYALTMKDSAESGVRYYQNEHEPEVGKTDFDWLGFRDVIDVDPDPDDSQELLGIPATKVHVDGSTREVASFHMSRYAVSNLEYLPYILSTGTRRPDGWEPQGSAPFPECDRHLPVVNVRYREAVGFCLWRSRMESRPIRLPKPDEWLAALQGGEARPFPWGPEFDPQRCNTLHSGWGKLLPVFELPTGCSRHGIYQLVGNICEWVSPTEVRGGSWQDAVPAVAPRGFRFTVSQDSSRLFRRRDIGFRYVSPT
jgi:formylglycine-generating enzyme required for sulfatase activity